MSIQRHIKEASHIINLNLMFIGIFDYNRVDHFLSLSESILQNQEIGKRNSKR